MFASPAPVMLQRAIVSSATFVSTKYRWFASSNARSPSSPNWCCSIEMLLRPGGSTKLCPPSTDVQTHDMLRVEVGEFASGASASCQFSLCAVTKMFPHLSTGVVSERQSGRGERLVERCGHRRIDGNAGRAVDRMHGDDARRGTTGREARVVGLEQPFAAALADERVEVRLVRSGVRVRVAVALGRPVHRTGERLVGEVEVRAPVRIGDKDAALLVHGR